MKKLLITLFILGLGTVCYSAGKIIVNPWQEVSGRPHIVTTKVTTEEGTYRVFIYTLYKGGGITAVKIK